MNHRVDRDADRGVLARRLDDERKRERDLRDVGRGQDDRLGRRHAGAAQHVLGLVLVHGKPERQRRRAGVGQPCALEQQRQQRLEVAGAVDRLAQVEDDVGREAGDLRHGAVQIVADTRPSPRRSPRSPAPRHAVRRSLNVRARAVLRIGLGALVVAVVNDQDARRIGRLHAPSILVIPSNIAIESDVKFARRSVIGCRAERARDPRGEDLQRRRRRNAEPRERRRARAGEPAGNDQIERVEVGRDVEREAVNGDAVADMDAEGTQLFVICPQAGRVAPEPAVTPSAPSTSTRPRAIAVRWATTPPRRRTTG